MKPLSIVQGSSIAIGVLSLAVYAVVFGLRYGWYLNSTDYLLMQLTVIASGLAIVAAWLLYPAPWLAVGVCASSFFLPPLLNPERYPSVDLQFLPYVVVCCALVALSAELRRRTLLQ